MRYTSPYHSDDDPGGLIREALTMGDRFPGPAEDLLLSWLLSLGSERKPPEVARRLLARHGVATGEIPPSEAGRLVLLLRQTAAVDGTVLARRGKRRRENTKPT
ncbi:MAG: hypothetical protein ACREDZ_07570 [Kiloniellales bacterium]